MKRTLKYDPVLTPTFKARMLRDRYEMFILSINTWCDVLRSDIIIERGTPKLYSYEQKDRDRINAWLYDYAAFCGGEM